MLVNGDKIVLTAPMGVFKNVGEVCDVIDVSNNVISFRFGNGMHMGWMSYDEFEKYFKKYEEPKKVTNTVTKEIIEEIMTKSNIIVNTVFDKCTVVSCRLPNGFVIVESSSCVDPNNYDEDMGVEICLDRIENKVWELEGYRLQEKLHRQNNGDDNNGCPYGDLVDCNYCDNDDCDCDCDDEDYDDDDDDCYDNLYFKCGCIGCNHCQ